MRLPRVRLKIWWIMAAVALVALALGGERCRRHYRRCQQAAAYHAKEARLCAGYAAILREGNQKIDRIFEDYVAERKRNREQLNSKQGKAAAFLVGMLTDSDASMLRVHQETMGPLKAQQEMLTRRSEHESRLQR